MEPPLRKGKKGDRFHFSETAKGVGRPNEKYRSIGTVEKLERESKRKRGEKGELGLH